MKLLTGLKRLDGQAMHCPGIDDFKIWEIRMHCVEKESHYKATIDGGSVEGRGVADFNAMTE